MNDIVKNRQDFLTLLRMGISGKTATLNGKVSWEDVKVLALRQVLFSVVADGVGGLPVDARPPEMELFQWIAMVSQDENRFDIQHTSEIDWEWLYGVLEDFHMMDFFNYLNAICIEDLGFDAGLFPSMAGVGKPGSKTVSADSEANVCEGSDVAVIDRGLKERILDDMIYPEFAEEEQPGLSFFRRVAFKYRRWQANAWKQRLCFSGSRFVAFWNSVWAHILKPESI